MKYSRETLATHPGFLHVLRELAGTLRNIHNDMPRLGRLLTSHQRWLMTQAAMMLYLEEESGGLTITRLRDVVTGASIASHNTAQNFLEQIESYRFVERIEGQGRRKPRRYVAAPIAEQAMFNWYLANLAALDGLDGAGRAAIFMQRPHLLRIAQPRMARVCLSERDWCEPPPRVAEFLWTEAGGLVIDTFISRIRDEQLSDDRIEIGSINAREMAEDFMMSRTHLQRLLRKAVDQGSIGWDSEDGRARSRKSVWFSRRFLAEYCTWQAVKFAAVNDAFIEALEADDTAMTQPCEANG